MSAQVFPPKPRSAMPSLRPWMPLVIITAIVSALALDIALYGATLREKASRMRAEEINQEDIALCERLDIPQGTDRFVICADILGQARRNEAKRLAEDAAGIL
jgi:hypothetical protein